MIYVLIVIGLLILTFEIIGFISKKKYWKQVINQAIENNKKVQTIVNDFFAEKKIERDKKYMEEQLRIKLDRDEKLKKIDEEILEKLRNIK